MLRLCTLVVGALLTSPFFYPIDTGPGSYACVYLPSYGYTLCCNNGTCVKHWG